MWVVRILRTCESTNDAASECRPGTVILALVQTHGRGRYGRRWYSEYGGLWCSVVLPDMYPPEKRTVAALAAGCAAAMCIKELGVEAVIKWPNDVMIGDRKIAGILTEHTDGKIIVGIGINLNNQAPEDVGAVSYKELTSRHADLLQVLWILLDYLSWILTFGPEDVIEIWKTLSDTPGRRVAIDGIEGIAVDVSSTGALIVDTAHGREEVLAGTLRYL